MKGIVAVMVLLIGLSASMPFSISTDGKSAMEKRFLQSLELVLTSSSMPRIADNSSLAINNSDINSTNESLGLGIGNISKNSMNGSSVISDTNDLTSTMSGSFKGFWGMEARKKSFGREGIHSKISLMGEFQVDRSVIFHEPSV